MPSLAMTSQDWAAHDEKNAEDVTLLASAKQRLGAGPPYNAKSARSVEPRRKENAAEGLRLSPESAAPPGLTGHTNVYPALTFRLAFLASGRTGLLSAVAGATGMEGPRFVDFLSPGLFTSRFVSVHDLGAHDDTWRAPFSSRHSVRPVKQVPACTGRSASATRLDY